jgi:hypothetical protein
VKAQALLAIALTLGACAPSWPNRATSITDPRLARGSIHTVDVLPADLQLWAEEEADVNPDMVQVNAEAMLIRATVEALGQRNERANVIDWNGNANGAPAMDGKALDATVGALSGYGSVAEDHPNALPIPYLPVKLGEATGADATLYVGGWSFVAKEPDHDTGKKILEGVLIVVAVVAVIGIIAAVSKGSGGHGGGGGGSAAGGIAKAATHVAGQVGRAALRAGNIAFEVAKTTTQIEGEVLEQLPDPILDAFGHIIGDAPARPDWSAGGPHEGDAQMYIEMTLVDNHTGLALWHAHQQFPANANHPDEVLRAVRIVLATMPR